MDNFVLKSFEALHPAELYEIMKLRQAVFVVEQDCPYLDADDRDLQAYHLYKWDTKGSMIAYCRIIPPGISYREHASIGRVVVDQKFRNKGMGGRIMREAIELCKKLFDSDAIKISGQSYLRAFYESLGFEHTGESYLEDGIPHIAMVLK